VISCDVPVRLRRPPSRKLPRRLLNFLIPGIVAQTAAFASFVTASRRPRNKKGLDSPGASMRWPAAVLAWRLVADTVR